MTYFQDFLSVAATEALRVQISGCAGIDCLGGALSADAAFRQLDAAKFELNQLIQEQQNAPHTEAADQALEAVKSAQGWLRDFSVSPESLGCPVAKN
jgi:hypothetical protein